MYSGEMAQIISSIFEKEISEIEKKLTRINNATVQIVLADNTLIPNESFLDIPQFSGMIKRFSDISFEVHLLVASPEKYIKPLVDAGFKRIIIQVECNDPRLFLTESAHETIDVGIAIDGPTEVEQVEPFLEEVDMVQVMTVEVGYPQQPFLPETIEKIKTIHQNFPHLVIAASGNIKPELEQTLIEAGAQKLVVSIDDFDSM